MLILGLKGANLDQKGPKMGGARFLPNFKHQFSTVFEKYVFQNIFLKSIEILVILDDIFVINKYNFCNILFIESKKADEKQKSTNFLHTLHLDERLFNNNFDEFDHSYKDYYSQR